MKLIKNIAKNKSIAKIIPSLALVKKTLTNIA
jgi:hypothetical protein